MELLFMRSWPWSWVLGFVVLFKQLDPSSWC